MTGCPNEIVLARAVSADTPPELAAHLAGCATCTSALDRDRRAIELARRIVVRVPASASREEMRTAILATNATIAAGRSAGPRRRWLVAGAVAMAAAVALIVAVRADDPSEPIARHPHGTIHPHDGARYTAGSTIPDEVVMLHDGAIDVEVTPLDPGERFRVITADSEIEVRGTAFAVTVRLGRLVSVVVQHGLVEVRPHGGTARLLATGESWAAPVITAVVTTPPPEPPPPPPVVRPRRAPTPIAPAPPPVTERSPQEVAYDAAWVAMRASDFAAAASTFARAGILDPDGPLAEDASYWYAVALARAKRPEALQAFREFLDRYPRSPRAYDSSAMLGWLLVDSERAEAERHFRFALGASSAKIRDSARAGLDALSGRATGGPR
ncbi:MAG: FecR domain-containing protein [Kofleriaceae bacterium]